MNIAYNFKEVGEKGKQEPKCLFDIRLDKPRKLYNLPQFLCKTPTFVGTPSHEHYNLLDLETNYNTHINPTTM
jgi:hypothetical protein